MPFQKSGIFRKSGMSALKAVARKYKKVQVVLRTVFIKPLNFLFKQMFSSQNKQKTNKLCMQSWIADQNLIYKEESLIFQIYNLEIAICFIQIRNSLVNLLCQSKTFTLNINVKETWMLVQWSLKLVTTMINLPQFCGSYRPLVLAVYQHVRVCLII